MYINYSCNLPNFWLTDNSDDSPTLNCRYCIIINPIYLYYLHLLPLRGLRSTYNYRNITMMTMNGNNNSITSISNHVCHHRPVQFNQTVPAEMILLYKYYQVAMQRNSAERASFLERLFADTSLCHLTTLSLNITLQIFEAGFSTRTYSVGITKRVCDGHRAFREVLRRTVRVTIDRGRSSCNSSSQTHLLGDRNQLDLRTRACPATKHIRLGPGGKIRIDPAFESSRRVETEFSPLSLEYLRFRRLSVVIYKCPMWWTCLQEMNNHLVLQ